LDKSIYQLRQSPNIFFNALACVLNLHAWLKSVCTTAHIEKITHKLIVLKTLSWFFRQK